MRATRHTARHLRSAVELLTSAGRVPNQETTMPSGGTEQSGYELEIDPSSRVLRLRCWGVWDIALAEGYRAAMHESFSVLRGKPWYVLGNITNFPPQSEAVARVHGALMAKASTLGMKRACNVVSSSLTQLQIRRISEASRLPEFAFFKDEQTALKWLLSS
jgi:hypothetical protein